MSDITNAPFTKEDEQALKEYSTWQFPSFGDFARIKEALHKGEHAVDDLFYSSNQIHPTVQVNNISVEFELERYDDPEETVLELDAYTPIKTDYLKERYLDNLNHNGELNVDGAVIVDNEHSLPVLHLYHEAVPPYISLSEIKDMDYETFCNTIKERVTENIKDLYQKGALDKETIQAPASNFWEDVDKQIYTEDRSTENERKGMSIGYPIDTNLSEENFEALKDAVRKGEFLDRSFQFTVGRQPSPTHIYVFSSGGAGNYGWLGFEVHPPVTKEEMARYYASHLHDEHKSEGEDYYWPHDKYYPETFTRDDFLKMDYETFLNKMEKEEIPTLAMQTFDFLQDAWDAHNPAIEKTLVESKVEKFIEDYCYRLYFGNTGEDEWPLKKEPWPQFQGENIETLIKKVDDIKETLLDYIHQGPKLEDDMRQDAKDYGYDLYFANAREENWPEDINAYLADPQKSDKKMIPWGNFEDLPIHFPISQMAEEAEFAGRLIYKALEEANHMELQYAWKQELVNISAVTKTFLADEREKDENFDLYLNPQWDRERVEDGRAVAFNVHSYKGEKRDLTAICQNFFKENGWTITTPGPFSDKKEDIIVSTNGDTNGNNNKFYIDAYAQKAEEIQLHGVVEEWELRPLIREFNEQNKGIAHMGAPRTNKPIYYISDDTFRDFCSRHVDELDALIQDAIAGTKVNGALSEKAQKNFLGKVEVEKDKKNPVQTLASAIKLQDQYSVKPNTSLPMNQYNRFESFLKQELQTMKRFGLVKENERTGTFTVGKPVFQMKEAEQAVTI